MEHEEPSVEIFEKFTWKVENFSRLTKQTYYMHFVLCGYLWRINLYPKGNKVNDYLSIYLEAMQTAYMSEGWSRDVKFKLFVINQVENDRTITRECDHKFNAKENDWGFKYFMKFTELCDPTKGFIVKDSCIVGAEIFVSKSTHEKQLNHPINLTVPLTSGCQTRHMEVEAPRPKVEVRGLNFETEDADAELVFATLGRVFYFLKTRKVKDMNEQACKELQALWDELKKFKCDLTWLEPHIQSALGMKGFVEKAMHVEKLKDNLVLQDLETERLKTKLVAAEVNLDAERDLLKAKGFKEIDLESELGCGSSKP